MADYEYPHRKQITIDGKTHDVKAKTEEELGRKIEKKELRHEMGLITVEASMTVRLWFKKYDYIYIEQSDIEEPTKQNKRSLYTNHIDPVIGAMRVKDVAASHCNTILHNLRGSSKDYINKASQLLIDIFQKAKLEKLIIDNPTEGLVRPAAVDGTRRPITMLERIVMLKVAEYHRGGLWIRTMMDCGFRPGETDRFLGCHINYEQGLIYIDGTKSPAAKRIVPAPPSLLADLKKLNREPHEHIFLNTEGNKMLPKARDTLWQNFKREMNIVMGCKVYRNQLIPPFMVADDLVPYCLRHRYATDLKDALVPYSIRQELLGHEKKSITDHYTHRSLESLQTAARLIAEFREKQNIEIQKMQKRIMESGYKIIEVPSDDLTEKFFPDIK